MRTGVTEMLEEEDEVKISKESWLSEMNSGKAYESMVPYLTKARQLLNG